MAVGALSLAVVAACGGDGSNESRPTDVSVGGTDDRTDEAAPGTDDTACPVIDGATLATVLDLPEPIVLQGGDQGCLWSFPDADTTLGSILVADASMGQGLIDSLADYDDEGLEAFGVSRIEGIDRVAGTFGPAGFVAVVDDAVTYQFALDGPDVDRSEAMLELVRVFAERS